MRKIAQNHHEKHLPLFNWADHHFAKRQTRELKGYRVDERLTVAPIWSELSHGL